MRTRAVASLILFAAVVMVPTSGTAAPVTPVTARIPAAAPIQPAKVNDTLRALDRLRSMGYSWTTDAGADRVIRAWQKANGLTVDGIVGPETLGSLHLDAPSVGGRPASKATTPVPPAPTVAPASAPPGDVEAIIRDVWPDDLEDWAVRIATRESNLQPGVINRQNGDATGLFQIMWSVHRKWLCPQMGVCHQSDLQDARTNAEAGLALYQRAGGPGPWAT